MSSVAKAEVAKSKLRDAVGRAPGVRGFAVTWDDTGDAHVLVNVDPQKIDEVRRRLPGQIDGVAVEFRPVGRMRAY